MLAGIAQNISNRLTRSELTKEVGSTGTLLFGGFLSGEDLNPKWESTEAIDNVEQMRRTDPKIKASLLALKLPILGASMRIEPASDDNTDMEIAQFVEKNLFFNPHFRWQDLLRQILTFLEFGFAVFEKTYVPMDGKLGLKKFEIRKQKTIWRWQTKDGILTDVEQSAVLGDDTVKPNTRISAEKIYHIANEQEGLNFRGVSVLRSAYRHFKIKDVLIRLDAIAHERWSAGIPHIETKDANDQKAKDVATSLRSHEKGYLITTPQYKVSLFPEGGARGNPNLIRSIEYHDKQIVANVLEDFMHLGTDKVGSYALGKTKADMFFKALEALATHIENSFNEVSGMMSVIPQIVSLNYNTKKFPKFRIEKLELANLDGLAERLNKYSASGFLTAHPEDEDWLRDIEEMPKVERDTATNIIRVDSGRPYCVRGKFGYERDGKIMRLVDVATGNRYYSEITNPFPNEHAARVRNPGLFDSKTFRRTHGGKGVFPGAGMVTVPSSIDIIWGKLKSRNKPSDNPLPQALRFPKSRWTAAEARKWLRDKKIKVLLFEPASNESDVLDITNQDKKRGKLVTPEIEEFEQKFVNLAKMERRLDESEERIEKNLANLRDIAVKKLIAEAVRIASKAKSVEQARKQIEAVTIPTRKMKDTITIGGRELFDFGRNEVKEEIGKQKKAENVDPTEPVTEDITEAKKAIAVSAAEAVRRFTTKLKNEFSEAVMTMVKTGNIGTDFVRERLARVSQKVFKNEAVKVLREAFGLGRGVEIAKNREATRRIIRSEILDAENTCDPCIQVDGRVFNSVDDPDFASFSRGVYDGCLGGDSCRGINIIEL